MIDARIAAFRARVAVVTEPTSSNIPERMARGQWRGAPGGRRHSRTGQLFSATAEHSLGDSRLIGKSNAMVGLDARGKGSPALENAAKQVIDVVMTLDARPVGRVADSLTVLAGSIADPVR